ncbi:MAG: hypothetical protein A07HB70_00261, partial [uncultured archaeon A07HB70]
MPVCVGASTSTVQGSRSRTVTRYVDNERKCPEVPVRDVGAARGQVTDDRGAVEQPDADRDVAGEATVLTAQVNERGMVSCK